MPTPDEIAEAFVARLLDGETDYMITHGILRRALLERMRVNVGLVAENTELKRRLHECEHGRRADPAEPGCCRHEK